MTKRKLENPLKDIDPILEDAFASAIQVKKDVSKPVRNSKAKSAESDMIADIQFPELTPTSVGKQLELDIFKNIPITVSVELGRAQISLKEMYELTEGSIIELERLVGEPLDLVVNGQIIAHGEVVAIDNNYGLRVTQIVAQANKQ
jgi:flagellar motor switch protein FliN/FliY